MTIPFAAAADDVSAALLALFILLLAAKLGEEICRRLQQPVVIGEILAGTIVGSSVLGLVSIDTVLSVFAELGVIFLLFWVGLETKLGDIRSVGKSATLVGVFGVVIPVAVGIGGAFALGASTSTAVFVGAALAATSVGITSAILVELDLQGGPAGRTILGAAVIDDILALLILALAVGLASEGGISFDEIALLLGLSTLFLLFFGLGGSKLLSSRPAILEAPKFADSPLMPAVLICLGLAVMAAEIGLAAVIGAFLAGMIIAETRDQNSIEAEVAPLYAFFAPFFFAVIGAQLDLGALADYTNLALLLAITIAAVATKYVGAWLGGGSLSRRDRAIVSVGMIPRGEVGVIVAGLGYSKGAIDADIFAVVVGMAILTTLIAPYMIRAAANKQPDAETSKP
ncbi:MAG: cation:proton antiporter [Solirubrobacterales bacterium]|nr:cation:proton antiporter [Solirubrobacterales bacterium]